MLRSSGVFSLPNHSLGRRRRWPRTSLQACGSRRDSSCSAKASGSTGGGTFQLAATFTALGHITALGHPNQISSAECLCQIWDAAVTTSHLIGFSPTALTMRLFAKYYKKLQTPLTAAASHDCPEADTFHPGSRTPQLDMTNGCDKKDSAVPQGLHNPCAEGALLLNEAEWKACQEKGFKGRPAAPVVVDPYLCRSSSSHHPIHSFEMCH